MGKRLLITPAFPPAIGGMQSHLFQRCKGASQDEIMVLAPRMEGGQEFDRRQRFKIYRWSNLGGETPGLRRALQFLLPLCATTLIYQREGFDTLECGQALPFAIIALLFQRAKGIPYLVWAYGNDILRPQRYRLTSGLLRLGLENADLVAAISQETKEEVLRAAPGLKRVIIFSPVIDTQRFNPHLDGSPIRQRYLLEGKRVLLTVSRLVERKGVDKVIRCLPRLCDVIPELVYVVVGSGPERGRLERLAQEMGISERVVFAGRVSGQELPLFYVACDLFIMPSGSARERWDVEGYGLVFLEASACGKPVIGGRGGGTQDAIEDGVTGLLIDPQDEDQVIEAILRILSDPPFARRLGGNGRRKALRKPDWSLIERL